MYILRSSEISNSHTEEFNIVGIIKSIKEVKDKNSKRMAFGILQDIDGDIDLIFFSNIWEKINKNIVLNKYVILNGIIEKNDSERICFKVNSLLNNNIKKNEETNVIHKIVYTIDELKRMTISVNDANIINKIKRYMHKIKTNNELPGEVFREYNKDKILAYIDLTKYLDENIIKVSNYGRIKINDEIEEPIEEGEGWFYIKTKGINYPLYRFVAEVWCYFPYEISTGWEVHHISNDGKDNTPENLLWIKSNPHKSIKNAQDKFEFKICENIEEIIEKLGK